MKTTNELKFEDYPTKTNFNLEAHIKALVNRESEVMADIPAPQNPTFEKPKKMKWSVEMYNFFKSNVMMFKP